MAPTLVMHMFVCHGTHVTGDRTHSYVLYDSLIAMIVSRCKSCVFYAFHGMACILTQTSTDYWVATINRPLKWLAGSPLNKSSILSGLFRTCLVCKKTCYSGSLKVVANLNCRIYLLNYVTFKAIKSNLDKSSA